MNNTIIVTLVVAFISFIIITNNILEDFENNPISSIPVQFKFNPLYTNAYYYQTDNQTYIDTLKNKLGGDCSNSDVFYTKWKTDTNEDIAHVNALYNLLYQYILDRIDDGQQIQKDNIRRYKINDDTILFDIEMLLHSEGKPYARHVNITAIVKNTGGISIKNVGMLGNVMKKS